ncbi:MAG: Holliday junction branch migration protein RuvA [candidate division Zixibacteria bacterium]|nr:Holliday junction branch migration protein RuvA [candidate division Zixibacteria bacterium]
MISSLTGILKAKSPGKIEVVVGGVGFALLIPLSTYQSLPELSQEVSLTTHLQVKDNGIDLVGFATAAERDMFELLIGVGGIGLKLALTILSGIGINDLLQSIAMEDKSLLSSISGVGAKTAGRMILELKEKIGRVATLADVSAAAPVGEFEEAILALEALGFARYVAKRAVESAARELGQDPSPERLVREALKAAT